MKKLIFFFTILAFVQTASAQESKTSTYYFNEIKRSSLDGSRKISFESTGYLIYNDKNFDSLFVKIKSFDDLVEFERKITMDKVRGISISESVSKFPLEETGKILNTFPNLDYLEFEKSSFLNPFPEKTAPFPEFIKNLQQLKILGFRHHVDFDLSNLSETVSEMPNLKGLFLISFYDSIGVEILEHPNLEALMFTSRNFKDQKLPINNSIKNVNIISARSDKSINKNIDQLSSFPNLHQLTLEYARFEGQGYFSKVPQLKHLHINLLDSLHSTNFYKELSTLQDLETFEVWIDGDSTQELSQLANLRLLKKLNLGRVATMVDPSFLKELKNLEDLKIMECTPDFSDFNFAILENLQKLAISYSELDNLNPNAFNNPKLESISLDNNKLTSLPSLLELPKLKNLFIENNQLSDVSFLNNNLKNLEQVNFGNNLFKSLEFSHEKLPKLKRLYAHYNQIEVLNANFTNLKNLEVLYLSNNQIEKIEGEINPNSTIQSIDLSFNKLKELPHNFHEIINLEKLNLNYNLLQSLPNGLSNLKIINLENQGKQRNREETAPLIPPLMTLSDDFSSYTKLEEIHLSGNPNLELAPVWQLLQHLPRDRKLNLTLSGIGEVNLPEGDFWSKIYWEQLDLSGNSHPNMPAGLKTDFKFNQLFFGKFQDLSDAPKNIRFGNRDRYQVFLELHDILINNDKTSDSIYISSINNVLRTYRFPLIPEKIIKGFELAEKRNYEVSRKILDYSVLADALFALDDYEKSLPLLELEFQKQKDSNVRIINFIESLSKKLESIYIKQESQEKLLDLWIETAVEFNQLSNFTKAALRIWDDNKPKADSILNLGLIAHEKNMDWNVSNNRQDIGMTLDYLEVALIAGDDYHQEKAKKLFSTWSDTADDNRKRIFNYLDGMITISSGNQLPLQSEEKIQGWNFGLIQQWIALIKDPNLKKTLSDWHDNHAKQ